MSVAWIIAFCWNKQHELRAWKGYQNFDFALTTELVSVKI